MAEINGGIMATFREYMADQAKEAQVKIEQLKPLAKNSEDLKKLFDLAEIVYLNKLATAQHFGKR